MYIEIEDPAMLESVRAELLSQGHDPQILSGDEWDQKYVPGSGVDVLAPFNSDRKFSRWSSMLLASLGVRTWTKNKFIFSPTYAGSDAKETRDVILDAKFAEGKAAYVASFGVNYLGRVNSDPRTLVLVDYKGDKSHHPDRDELIDRLISSLPEDTLTSKTETSWTSFGIASSGNVEKLRDFLDYYEQTNILAYSEGAKAKLRYLERDFAEIAVPSAPKDIKYGKSLRAAASSLRPWA